MPLRGRLMATIGAPDYQGSIIHLGGLLNLPPPANMALRIQHLGGALSVLNLRDDDSGDPLDFGRKIDGRVNPEFHLESVHRLLCSSSNDLRQVRAARPARVVLIPRHLARAVGLWLPIEKAWRRCRVAQSS